MKVYIYLAVFCLTVVSLDALSCLPCDKSKCPSIPSLNCKMGTVRGLCGCCLRCAKVESEKCGGPFGSYGQCELSYLYCNKTGWNGQGNIMNAVGYCACPANKPRVQCTLDPCRTAKCEADPAAKCVPVYCGGCDYKFYDVNATDVTVKCKATPSAPPVITTPPTTTPPTTARPSACPRIACRVNACRTAKCAKYPKASCVSKCNGCVAVFYDHNTGMDVTDRCKTGCPPGKGFAQCFARPCSVTRCPAYPGAMCEDDYCGGCHARFYDCLGNDVKC